MNDNPTTGAPAVVAVPMVIDALSVTAPVADDPFWRASPTFAGRFRDPEPRPLDFGLHFGTKPEHQGVYLHWHMPAALGKGRLDLMRGRNADLWYPTVPNRWLILRYHHRRGVPQDQHPDAAGWLVYSDVTDTKPPSTKQPDKGGLGTSRVGPALWMGHTVPLTNPWTEPAGGRMAPLTVLGPGMPAFAAFQPYCQDVFSFHDPLTDDTYNPAALPAGDLSYLVVGWHAAAADDPLAAQQIDDLLAFFCPTAPAARTADALHQLGWTMTPTSELTGQERSVYAGTVLGLAWDAGAKTAPPSKKPDGHQGIKIAVGHDMADASAALIHDSLDLSAYHAPGPATHLLRAFHTGNLAVLDRAADSGAEAELLDTAAHHDWFSPAPRGTWWKLTPPDQPSSALPSSVAAGHESPYPRAALARLNAAQVALDRQRLTVAQAARMVADLWFLQGLYSETHGTKPEFDIERCKHGLDPTQNAGPRHDFETAAASLKTRTTTRDQARADAAKDLPKGWSLTEVALPSFHAPADPTILVSGAGTPLSDSLATGKALNCRRAGQVVTIVTVAGKGGSADLPVTAPAVADLRLPAQWAKAVDSAPEPVRPLLGALARELHTLHTVAHYLREAGDLGDDRLGTPLNKHPRVRALTGDAQWPNVADVWEQPWRPLTLAWKATCRTVSYEDSAGAAQWTFNGSHRQLAKAVPARETFSLQGRSLLSETPVTTLRRRIDAHLDTYPDAPPKALADFRALAGRWNLASQRLAGLRGALGRRTPAFHLDSPPVPRTDAAAPAPAIGTYEPVQAMQFTLDELNIVDTFGRGVIVIDPKERAQHRVVRSPSVTPAVPALGFTADDVNRLVQLAPRLPQPARLCLTPLAHTASPSAGLDKVVDADSDPLLTADTPVAGWLVVRRSRTDPKNAAAHWHLAVYAPDGQGLGEIRYLRAPKPAQDAVTWLPLPDSPLPTARAVHTPAFATRNPALAGFLRALVDQEPDAIAAGQQAATQRPNRLMDLARSIDQTLMSTAHSPGNTRVGAGMVAGRALALVRTRVHLELDGEPRANPSWNKVFDPPAKTDPHLDRRWPVRLGAGGDLADGLVGYFTGPLDHPGATDYELLHAVHPPHDPVSTYTKAIVRTDGTTGADVSVPARPLAETVKPVDAAYLTLLMDPHTTVAACTDVLPVVTYRLPPPAVAAHLEHLTLAVPLGPVLTRVLPSPAGQPPAPARLSLPTPDAGGDWHFAVPPRPPATSWTTYGLSAAVSEPRLTPTAPDTLTGHLTLAPKKK
ncbi:hypothetical protein [Kitasatospora sp. NPDC089509]|uniref:hypothetical protein n=1 Tax=Kitasatospora sp. NPDC089509 TaxID=3364079 RepID=UPI00381B2FE8